MRPHIPLALLALLLATALTPPAQAADASSLPAASWDHLPAWHGTNILNRFHLEWQNKPFAQADFQHLADFGFNFVRLPMDYRVYTASDDWLSFDESVLQNLDQAIAWCNALGIHAQINLHRIPGYTVATPAEATDLWTDPDTQAVAAAHWAMFAQRYAHLPNTHLSFNLLNEPAGAVTPAQYANVVSIIADAIRAQDPDRLIVADGLDYASTPVLELIPLQVAQAFHMYEPFNLTHYRATWVTGSEGWAEPVWPANTVSGYLYAPNKSDLHSTLTIATTLSEPATLRIKVGTVSSSSTLQVHADGQLVYQHDFQPGPGQGDWLEVVYNETYNIYQNLYLKDYYATIPQGTQQVTLTNAAGDWMTLYDLGLQLDSQTSESTLVPGNASYGTRQDTPITYTPTTGFATDDSPGSVQLWEDRIAPWAALKSQGVGVMAGEWGVHNQTPHPTTLAWTRDLLEALTAAEIGWAQWDYYGSFGPFDSGRSDINYEPYQGRQLDRAMMDLLQDYALHRESYSAWSRRIFDQTAIPTTQRQPDQAPLIPNLPNLACYAHALDPFQYKPVSLPRIQPTPTPSLALTTSPTTVALAIQLQTSTDLNTWQPLPQIPEQVPTTQFYRLAYQLILSP